MKLTVLERLLIQGLLPEKGSYTNLKLIRVAREALSFTDAENKTFEFEQIGDQLKWKNKENVEIAIKNFETAFLNPSILQEERDKISEQIDAFKKKLSVLENVPEEKEIKIGEIVTEMIKKKLKELDEKQELQPQQASLYEKFIEAKEETVH